MLVYAYKCACICACICMHSECMLILNISIQLNAYINGVCGDMYIFVLLGQHVCICMKWSTNIALLVTMLIMYTLYGA